MTNSNDNVSMTKKGRKGQYSGWKIRSTKIFETNLSTIQWQILLNFSEING